MKVYVSIVIPVYNEEGNIEELVHSIRNVMSNHKYLYEILLINDGSKDRSWKIIKILSRKFIEVVGINLVGNYGQTIALRAGFEKAEGEIIIAMDGDLQHDPKYIPQFLEVLIKGDYDMVGGAKSNRKGSLFSKVLSKFAHYLIQLISGVKMEYFGATFKAYRSYLLKNINMLGDSHRFLGAMLARKGTRYKEIPIEINERKAGKSNYSITKTFSVIIDLIFLKFFVSYFHKPFRIIGMIGFLNFTIGTVLSVIYIGGSFFYNFHIRQDYLAEFLFSIFLILIGTILITLGIIAELTAYNYFQKNFQSPYKIKAVIKKEGRKASIIKENPFIQYS